MFAGSPTSPAEASSATSHASSRKACARSWTGRRGSARPFSSGSAGTCVGIVERDRLIDGSRIEAGDAVAGLPSAGVHANGFTLVRRILELEDYEGEDLLAPTRLYLDDVRGLRERADVRGLAYVTGGGILGNLARVLPEGLRAELDWASWERPPVFDWLAHHVDEDELREVFNLGVGYIAVVPDPGDALVIGTIVRA